LKILVEAMAILLALALTISVKAETTLGVYDDLATGSKSFDLNVSRNLNEKVGMFAYATVSEYWSEAYAGPTFSPNANCQVGLGLGVESGQSSARWGGFAWAGQGKASILYLFEDGGSGAWHKLKAGYQVSPRVSVAVLEKTSAGLGLNVEYKLDTNTCLRVETFGNKVTTAAVLIKL
jgi:hypothetical protein